MMKNELDKKKKLLVGFVILSSNIVYLATSIIMCFPALPVGFTLKRKTVAPDEMFSLSVCHIGRQKSKQFT